MATTLEWDAIDQRTFERGLDRVTIYLNDGTAIPWSGVVSIDEESNISTSSTYYEGSKVGAIVETDAFSGSISAITYPDIVTSLEGGEKLNNGIYLTNQYPRSFGMSYRTGVGNAQEGPLVSYKIHIIFGVIMTPQSRSRQTINSDAATDLFGWDITTIPPTIGNYKPTSHIVIDEATVPEIFLPVLHNALWGDGTNPPDFGSIDDLIETILAYAAWSYTDHGDGTFTATPLESSYLEEIDPNADFPDIDHELFELHNVEIEVLDANTFILLNGYSEPEGCSPRIVGSFLTPEGDDDCLHMVRSALRSDELAHYIGTAPHGSQEIQPLWRITRINFGPPVTIVVNTNVRWTERESY